MSKHRLYLKRNIRTGGEARKLVLFSLVLALFADPLGVASGIITGDDIIKVDGTDYLWFLLFSLGWELAVLLVFFTVPTLLVIALFYFLIPRSLEKIQKVSYGYIAGFMASFLLLALVFRADGVLAGLVGGASGGFALGVILSLVSTKPLLKLQGEQYNR